jgi:PHD/YefM family antitoxin component YafN of YafNO toxin-antitoxin module
MLGVKEFALGLLAGSLIAGTGSWYVQGLRIDKLKSEHEIFIQKTKSVGEIVQVKSDTITVTQEKAKEVADVDYKEDFNRLNSELKLLRNQRASTSYTPAATANSRSPDLACFDRTELEQAFRFLDAGISELTQEGDTNALRLSVGMKWASDLQKR